jgi:hypothetical protein
MSAATSTPPDLPVSVPIKTARLSRPLAALLAIAAVLVAGIAVAAVIAVRPHSGPSHNTYWSQGHQYGQSHAEAASIAPQPVAQWCALMAYQVSGYTHLKQEGDWAHGCAAALAGQS